MEEREELKQDLGMLNVSLMFLLLIIFAVLLSLWSALIQRRQLELALEGGDPSKVLCLALDTRRQAQAGGTPAANLTAQVTVTASLLVLLAAILRLVDLQTVEQEQQTPLLEETTLPD